MSQGTQENINDVGTVYGTRRVLIFDEDIEDMVQHSKPFEAYGIEVHKCMSAETAMRCVEREDLDFALVDQGSQAFEGLRVIRHLLRYNLLTPFVVMAQCKDARWCQQAFALGAMEYLKKPVPSAEMNRIIKAYLRISLTK